MAEKEQITSDQFDPAHSVWKEHMRLMDDFPELENNANFKEEVIKALGDVMDHYESHRAEFDLIDKLLGRKIELK